MLKTEKEFPVAVPIGTTAIFLFSDAETAKKAIDLSSKLRKKQFIFTSGLKILYRKDAWSLIET